MSLIHEALYHWQREGWSLAAETDGQYTLTHAKARPVVCGSRTSFQTLGQIQGEMKRALEQGPRPVRLPPAIPEEPKHQPRQKKRRSTARDPEQPHSTAPERPGAAFRSPYAAIRPKPEQPSRAVQRAANREPFFDAAFELAKLKILAAGGSPDVFPAIYNRYCHDEDYRFQVIQQFRKTSPDEREQLRQQVEGG